MKDSTISVRDYQRIVGSAGAYILAGGGIVPEQDTDDRVVTVVNVPGLAPGGDVVDFLEAGHDLDALLALVAQTPAWFPGGKEQRRAQIRGEQAKQRIRKYRAKTRAVGVPDLAKGAAGSDADALSAVLTTLDAVGEPRSGRALKAALVGIHTRRRSPLTSRRPESQSAPDGWLICAVTGGGTEHGRSVNQLWPGAGRERAFRQPATRR